MVPRKLYIKLNVIFAIVLLRFEYVLGTCIERDEQIQKYLTSSKPPFDNYLNISKAVYPSVDLPSLLIDITVKFLKTAGKKSNGSSSLSTLEQNVSRSTTFEIRKFKWSMSCLYVSGGISLSAMNWFSLGAIYPNRRGSKLHITLPQFCNGFTVDRQDTMIYFLSTLQDIAVNPSVSDPRLNTVECVIPGHGKGPHLSGVKQLLHGVCWSLLVISLTMSTLTSQWIIVELKSWDNSKIAAAMLLPTLLFLGGLFINLYTWISATDVENEQDIYVKVFFGFICFVLLRRVGWCMYVQKKLKCFSELNLTKGHGKMTTENLFSGVVLYPAVFITYHHLLWILLGMITEPFWGFTILVAVISLCATFFFFVSELYCVFPKKIYSSGKCKETFIFVMSFLLIVAVLFAFVLFMLVLFAVAQASMGESLISTLIQNILTFVVTAWLGYMNILTKSNPGDKREGGDECDGNGAEGSGGEGNKGSANGKTKKRKKGMKKEEEVPLQVRSQKLPEKA